MVLTFDFHYRIVYNCNNRYIKQDILWDTEECIWCDSNRCSYNTYDFDGNIQKDRGSSCYIPDTQCDRTSSINGTLISSLCELNVSSILIKFLGLLTPKLFNQIPFFFHFLKRIIY